MSDQSAMAVARADLEAWRAGLWRNRLDQDPVFLRLLRRYLGEGYAGLVPELERLAEASGAALDRLVIESNRDENLPVLRRHDADGRPVEAVVFHPSYHAAGRVFWGSGVLSVLGEPGSEVLSGARAYLLDQHGEGGHACPVACTAGAIKLLRILGTEDQRARYLPALLERDYDRRLHAAQFVTEVQGGSDVGVNACRAVPEPGRPGWYRISGEKWFCSVADAGLFVVSARLEGAPAGTRGLGLFLVPRTLDRRVNGFALRRLKYKLGTRSMATGEIEFEGALAEAIGPTDQGFRNLVGIVLDASRVHNALAACGISRRALMEAQGYARSRRAFGARIFDFAPVQEVLARMRLRSLAGLATTFRLLAMTDRCERGEGGEALVAARRIGVMINKYWTSLAATRSVRDGIEILGGNGTIEDFSVLPRLYRDAIVIESWEGTHNTLCAQVLRDFAERGLHHPWLEGLTAELGLVVRPELDTQAGVARGLRDDVKARIETLLGAEPGAAAAGIRAVVDRMCRLTDLVALLSQAQWDLENGEGEDLLPVLELYRLLELERSDPADRPELAALNAELASRL
ncbi:MAG: acyl-CoA dehydrogenase family protein [Kiloniellales bacterium]|nr:acyl-CoA dehydrogenase family protein [Kiloniellales bacterium]